MKRSLPILSLTALSALALSPSAHAQVSRPIELGLTAGYASGLSGEAFVHVPNLAGPIGVKLSAAYTAPRDSIVDNADPFGTGYTYGQFKANGATESGRHLLLGLDGTYNLGEVTPGIGALLYAGGRYGMFSADFTMPEGSVTGERTTHYSMNSFGVGAGAQLSYALAGNLSLVGDLGVDQYFNSTLNVSGASNDSFAPSEADYSKYRSIVAFPGTVFKARIGFKFGGY